MLDPKAKRTYVGGSLVPFAGASVQQHDHRDGMFGNEIIIQKCQLKRSHHLGNAWMKLRQPFATLRDDNHCQDFQVELAQEA